MALTLDTAMLRKIEVRARHDGRPDVVQMVREIRKLRKALRPFAARSFAGYDALSARRVPIRVTEGQLARAWFALNDDEVPG